MKKNNSSSPWEEEKGDGSIYPKKHLGQHFLHDENIAKKIVDTLTLKDYKNVLEIGPGMGILTKYLLQKDINLSIIEIDNEAVTFLHSEFNIKNSKPETHPDSYRDLKLNIIQGDFLKYNITKIFDDKSFAIIGNFPYNISSQILFKTLTMRNQVVELCGMFQKEVAERICKKEGNKTYGILSVLTQAFYDTNYLFTVSENVFTPPPKVKSGVLHLKRKENYTLPCNEKLFFNIVKTSFNQRRKTLRNSLKTFNLSPNLKEDAIFGQRPEQLSVSDFISLTLKMENDLKPPLSQ